MYKKMMSKERINYLYEQNKSILMGILIFDIISVLLTAFNKSLLGDNFSIILNSNTRKSPPFYKRTFIF